jgi:hypothetical protein
MARRPASSEGTPALSAAIPISSAPSSSHTRARAPQHWGSRFHPAWIQSRALASLSTTTRQLSDRSNNASPTVAWPTIRRISRNCLSGCDPARQSQCKELIRQANRSVAPYRSRDLPQPKMAQIFHRLPSKFVGAVYGRRRSASGKPMKRSANGPAAIRTDHQFKTAAAAPAAPGVARAPWRAHRPAIHRRSRSARRRCRRAPRGRHGTSRC